MKWNTRTFWRMLAGLGAKFGFGAWRRYFTRRRPTTPPALEMEHRQDCDQSAMLGVLRRVATTQQEDMLFALNPQQSSAPTLETQTTCATCGNQLSEAGDGVIYRRFEGGPFNSFCCEQCHQAFLERRTKPQPPA